MTISNERAYIIRVFQFPEHIIKVWIKIDSQKEDEIYEKLKNLRGYFYDVAQEVIKIPEIDQVEVTNRNGNGYSISKDARIVNEGNYSHPVRY